MIKNEFTITAKEIAREVKGEIVGDSQRAISSVSYITKGLEKSLTFAKKSKYFKFVWGLNDNVVLCPSSYKAEIVNKAEKVLERITLIFVEDPALAFIEIYNKWFNGNKITRPFVHPTAIISKKAKIGKDPYIDAYVVIKDGCNIGNGVTIFPSVTIYENSNIGNNVVINSSAVIGKEGFEYERNNVYPPFRYPHLGGTIIEDNVEIGSNCVIDAGLQRPTVIKKGTKFDNLVHVGHSVEIGESCMITACAEFSGSVIVGNNVHVSPNASIIDGVRIGNKSLVGIGAVVNKDVEDNTRVIGNPAKAVRDFIRREKYLNKVVGENGK